MFRHPTIPAKKRRVARKVIRCQRRKVSARILRRSLPRYRAKHARKVAALRTPQGIARELLRKRGWSGQFGCLNALIMRESKWNVYADNPTSSAYGIPQALPGSKMASHGSDWATNPRTQLRWMLDYIAGRYGTPCGALAFSHANGYY